jgi:hypothetical protein
MDLTVTSNIDEFIGKVDKTESALTGGWLPLLGELQLDTVEFFKSVSPVVSGLFRSEIQPGNINESGFNVWLDADAVNDTTDSGYKSPSGVNYGWYVLDTPGWSQLGYDLFGRDSNVSQVQDMVNTRVSEFISSCLSGLE